MGALSKYRMINDKKKLFELAELILFAVIVFVINIIYVGKFNTFYVLNDEFGYWASAAKFAGYDWSSAASTVNYYSYGYSLLLFPLFAVFKDPAMLYKAALVMNAAMMSGCVFLAKGTAKNIAKDVSGFRLNIISLAVCLFPACIVHTRLAWTESLLFLMFWLVVYFTVLTIKKPGFIKCAALAVICIYTYMCHQRMLGIVVAVVVTMAALLIAKRMRFWHFICFAGVIAVCIAVHTVLKNNVVNSVWQGAKGSGGTDYSSQFGKLDYVLSVAGLKILAKRSIGQIYYLCASTLLAGLMGFIEAVCRGCSVLRKKRRMEDSEGKNYFYMFLLLAVIATCAISFYFVVADGGRTDHLMYGRYVEVIAAPVMLTGFIWLMQEDRFKKIKVIGSIVFFAAISMYVHYFISAHNSSDYNIVCGPSLLFLPEKTEYVNVLFTALCVIGIFLLLMLLFEKGKLSGVRVTAGALAVMILFVCCGFRSIKKTVLTMAGKNSRYAAVTDYIKKADDDLPVYYIIKNNFNEDRPKAFVQMALADRSVQCIEYSEFDKSAECYVILSNTLDEGFFDVAAVSELCTSANDILLFKTGGEGNDEDDGWQLNLSVTNGASVNDGVYTSAGAMGVFTYGPYFNLEKGSYYIEFDTQVVAKNTVGAEREGYISVKSGDTTVAGINIYSDENGESVSKLTVMLELEQKTESLEIITYAEQGSVLSVSDFRLYRNKGEQ